MSLDTWLIYLLAATGLSLSPGPNGLLALTHGALHGHAKAMYTIGGGALGFVLVIALSMFGIGALLQTSLLWLTVMKWLGGAYLVWLGVQVWRAPPIAAVALQPGGSRVGGWSLFRAGALSAMTNPNGILFFAAFLPQFIDPHAAQWPQYATLGVATAALDLAVMAVYALGGAHLVRRLSLAAARRLNRACAAGLLALAGGLALYRRSAD